MGKEKRKIRARCKMCGEPIYMGQSHHVCAPFTTKAIEYRRQMKIKEILDS